MLHNWLFTIIYAFVSVGRPIVYPLLAILLVWNSGSAAVGMNRNFQQVFRNRTKPTEGSQFGRSIA